MKTIGIVCWPDVRDGVPVYEINERFATQVERAGARPLLIPVLAPGQDAAQYMEWIDGLLLIGGADIASFRYGEDPHPEAERYHFRRDDAEWRLFEAAMAANKKVLAVCRGMHLVNVALGGTLWQHLPDNQSTVVHGGGRPDKKIPYHRIRITGGRMKEIYGEEAVVNSFHHQGLREVANGLVVTARSHDGLPEAVENNRILGVQFHPEFEEINVNHMKLYERFIAEL